MTATQRTQKPLRVKLLGALHAEGAKRGLSHEELRARAGCESLSTLTVEQLDAEFLSLTGRRFYARHPGVRGRARRRAAGAKNAAKENVVHLARPEDLRMLYDTAYRDLGWDHERLRGFIRRQLKGKQQIRTMAEFNSVWRGVQAQARRARKAATT